MAYDPSMYMPQWQPAPQPQPNWYYQPTRTQPVSGLVGVTGIEGAKAYQLPPNSKMPLFDNDADILYLKTTDSAGYPTIKAFKFEPIEDGGHGGGFATKEDIETLQSQIDALKHPAASKSTRTVSRKASDGE